jgi:hypothetical protein
MNCDFTTRPVRYSGNPIVPLDQAAWRSDFINDPVAMIDPNDSSTLLIWVTGVAAPGGVRHSLGLFTAPVSDPYTLTEYGQVLFPGSAGQFDADGMRIGDVWYDAGTFYMLYTGFSASETIFKIGLATSADGRSWTKHGSNPIFTCDGNGRDDGGDKVDAAAVLKEGSTLSMVYSYYTDSVTLPGFRYATASTSDPTTWTKQGSGDILTIAPLRAEKHQIWKSEGVYYLLYEAGSETEPFRIYLATAPALTGPWRLSPFNPILKESGLVGASDRYHVSTPYYVAAGGRDLLYFSPAGDLDQPYWQNRWPLSVATYVRRPARGGSIFRI